jgi:hypothetical protein
MIYDKEMIALKHCKKMNDMIYDKEMIALKHCKKMNANISDEYEQILMLRVQ